MSIAALSFLNTRLQQALNNHYAFMRWNEKPPDDYYFTGEYREIAQPNQDEDGRHECSIILRGYTWKDWLLLEQAKETIEKEIPTTAILPDGTGIAIFYDAGMVVPTGLDNFKSIKIDLTMMEWKV